MKIIFKLFYIIVFAFILIKCKPANAFDCLKSNGSEETVSRNVGYFYSISLSGKIELSIVQGQAYNAEVTAGKNLLNNISTTVNNGTLTIENNNKCNFVRGYKHTIKVKVTVPNLKSVFNLSTSDIWFSQGFNQDTIFLRCNNAGDIHIDGNFNQLTTSAHGNGNIYVSGNTNSFNAYMNGTTFLYANTINIASYAFIETLSIGDAYINLPNGGVFQYNIWRSGNIYYTGNPAVITNYSNGSGSGKAIRN
ncbi:MAG: DUF2807 domain-containing protein [Bacteroidetes bacterium]|nr:DUF2807 domain-containing protein [Bacteroidota bacterium]